MNTDQKLIAFAITAALIAVLSLVAYNEADSMRRVKAYKQCLETQKEIAPLTNYGVPSCSMR